MPFVFDDQGTVAGPCPPVPLRAPAPPQSADTSAKRQSPSRKRRFVAFAHTQPQLASHIVPKVWTIRDRFGRVSPSRTGPPPESNELSLLRSRAVRLRGAATGLASPHAAAAPRNGPSAQEKRQRSSRPCGNSFAADPVPVIQRAEEALFDQPRPPRWCRPAGSTVRKTRGAATAHPRHALRLRLLPGVAVTPKGGKNRANGRFSQARVRVRNGSARDCEMGLADCVLGIPARRRDRLA